MKVYSREEVYSNCLRYFNGDELAANSFFKYVLRDKQGIFYEKDPDQMHRRLASEFARIEKKFEKKALSETYIYNLFKNFRYIVPQGSPMMGIGNNFVNMSLSNCVVVASPEDNMSSIMDSAKELANLYKRRCGVGIDISNLRPDGAPVNNSAISSTGAWSFADLYSYVTRMVGQSGRRGALMITIDVRHPDIEKFIVMKHDLAKVTGANVSVRLSDDFMHAVEADADFELRWPCEGEAKIKRTVKAKDVWNLIVDSATKTAEPGLMMWDNIIKTLPAHCYPEFKTLTTNPSLRENTLIQTHNGVFPIRWLAENEPQTLVKNALGEWKECKVFKSGINKQLFRITFTNGQEVYCTKEHKWPLLNTLGNLFDKRTGKVNKKETSSLSRGDKIPLLRQCEPINNRYCSFSKEDGFVLGWNLGDGWISKHKSNNNVTQYGFQFSEEDIENGIGERVLNYTNGLAKRSSSLRRDKDSKSFTYVTTDKVVREHFESLGACNKKEGIPTTLWYGNKDFIAGFIDGLFSAGGCISLFKNKPLSSQKITLISAHENILKDVQKLFNFYGIRSYVNFYNTENSFPNGKSGIYRRGELVIRGVHAVAFANQFNLSNKNKQEKLNKILELLKEDSSYKNSRDYLVVKSVEATSLKEDVYDITVFDDTHTFVTEVGTTGNCGEIPLSAYDSCRLISQNLKWYVTDPFTSKAKFDFHMLEQHTRDAMRLSDDLVELEIEKLFKIMEAADTEDEKQLFEKLLNACVHGRRTGLGTHGLADALARLCLPYDSDEALEVVEKIYELRKNAAYRESVELAKERGSFAYFDWNLEKENVFIQSLAQDIKEDLEKYGRRNISILTNAPTGTVSIMSQTSSGLEPVFRNSYVRRKKLNHGDEASKVDFVDDLGDKWQEFTVYHHNVADYYNETGKEAKTSPLPDYFVESNEIDWMKRVEIQAAIQKHVDHSISSTINLPKDTSPEVVGELYLEGWKRGLKGLTVYVDGSRSGVLVEKKESEEMSVFKAHDAPKRPIELPCDIHHVNVKGEKWLVFVGLFNGRPYEVFGGLAENVEIPKEYSSGIIYKGATFKHAPSRYDLKVNGFVIRNIVKQFDNPMYGTHTRLISMSLRHGALPSYVVEQLLKDPDTDLMSFSKVLSRVLKKYIQDGTIVRSDKACSECGAETLIYQEGCATCQGCGYAKCG